ncbi:MAG: sulfur carrier protein ThiS [Gammaproteobacteria bacterium]|nr:sulfur carrier protein ThiS [Gammaproteobacteria bacterium]
MQITVNGEVRESNRTLTITALLEEMGLAQRRVAVEVNKTLVPRSLHTRHMLAPGDQVEIVQAIGGG